MGTGLVDTWANTDKFGPIYPFVGTEVFLVIVGVIFWIAWHVWQIKAETAEFNADIEKIKERGGIVKILEEEKQREIQD